MVTIDYFVTRNGMAIKKVAKYILWCIEEDYMIVLEERERDAILITTYCVLYVNFSLDI